MWRRSAKNLLIYSTMSFTIICSVSLSNIYRIKITRWIFLRSMFPSPFIIESLRLCTISIFSLLCKESPSTARIIPPLLRESYFSLSVPFSPSYRNAATNCTIHWRIPFFFFFLVVGLGTNDSPDSGVNVNEEGSSRQHHDRGQTVSRNRNPL